MVTCNGIVDILSGHCGIHEQPIVPADNLDKSGINVLVFHHEPIPKYPERTRNGLDRLVYFVKNLSTLCEFTPLHFACTFEN